LKKGPPVLGFAEKLDGDDLEFETAVASRKDRQWFFIQQMHGVAVKVTGWSQWSGCKASSRVSSNQQPVANLNLGSF
jgi:hypothetical protein